MTSQAPVPLFPSKSYPRSIQGTATRPLSAPALTFALFVLSFATVLFVLVIFRLLSFFIMPSLFFDLLFIGFPVGAMVGTWFFSVDTRGFLRSLWILQGAILMCVAATFLAHNFDYLRVHLFEVEVSKLLLNMGIFTSMFLPFFVAYGLSEYIGYQIGRKVVSTRMRLVYAIFLFGAAAAYVTVHALVAYLGVSRLVLVAVALTSVSAFIVAHGIGRLVASVQIAIAVGCMMLPGIESSFLKLYKGQAPQSTREFAENDCELVFQQWGRYSLCEIMSSPDKSTYFGFYNDFFQWEYSPEQGYSEPSLGAVPMLLTPPDGHIAIIGSGGGRQVRFATTLNHKNITAVELEPAVIDAVRNPNCLLDEFEHVYDQECVEIIQSEGRRFLESSDTPLDLIFLPSVGGYPQMMLEPGNLIRTYEAYEVIRNRLAEDGWFAIWYPIGLDDKGMLTQQYVRTLRDLRMNVRAYVNQAEYLILARRDRQSPLPRSNQLLSILFHKHHREMAQRYPGLVPSEFEVADDEGYRSVTDDRPFLGGNLRHVFSITQACQLYGTGAVILAIVGGTLLISFRRIGDPQIPGRSYWSMAMLAFLLGANFLAIEHFVVLTLFQTTYVYYDALMLGAVSFLILSGIGSIVSTKRTRNSVAIVSIITLLVAVLAESWLPQTARLVMMLPVAVATGMFFPALFERAAGNPLGVFALDAIGSGVGALLAAFVPLALGFAVYGYLATAIFVATVVADLLFHAGIRDKLEHGLADGEGYFRDMVQSEPVPRMSSETTSGPSSVL